MAFSPLKKGAAWRQVKDVLLYFSSAFFLSIGLRRRRLESTVWKGGSQEEGFQDS